MPYTPRKTPKPCKHADWRFNEFEYAPKGTAMVWMYFRCGECGAKGKASFYPANILWTNPRTTK